MNKKTLLIALVLILTASLSVFAKGETEAKSAADVWETVSVTGTISFRDYPHPELTSGRTVYELLVPQYALYEIDVEAGATVTVEGIRMETPDDSDDVYLRVVKAIIDGEEYEVPAAPGYGGGRGFAHDRMPMSRPGGPWDDDKAPGPGSRFGGNRMMGR